MAAPTQGVIRFIGPEIGHKLRRYVPYWHDKFCRKHFFRLIYLFIAIYVKQVRKIHQMPIK